MAEALGPDGLANLLELSKLDDGKLADLIKLAETLGPDGLAKLLELAKLDDGKLADLLKLAELLGPDGLAKLLDLAKLDDGKLADLIKLAETLGPDGLAKLLELAKLDDGKLADLIKLAESLGPDGLASLLELSKLDDGKLADLIKLAEALGPDGLAKLLDLSKLDDSKLADLIKLAELLGPNGLEKLIELAKLDDAKLADLIKLAESLGPDGLDKLAELAKLDDSKLANLIKLGELLGPDGLANLAELAKLDDSKLAELIKLAEALGPDGLKSLSDLAKLDDSKLAELAKLAEALGPEGLKNLAKLSDLDDEKLKLLAHLADTLGPNGLETLSGLAGIDDSKLAELAKLAELVGPDGLKRLEDLAKLDQEKLDEIKKLAEALGPNGLDKVSDPRLNDLAKLLDLLGPDGLNRLEDPRLPDLAKLAEMLGPEALEKLLELAKLTGMKGGNNSDSIDLPRLAELGRLAKELGPEELSRLVDPNLLGLAGLAGDSGVSKGVKPSDLARLARLDAELAGLADPNLAALIEKLRENLDSTLSDLIAKAEKDLLANPEALSELSHLKSQANLDPNADSNIESDLSENEKVLLGILNSSESPEKMSQDFQNLPESSDPNQSLDSLGSKLRRKPGVFNKLKALRKALGLTPINEDLTRANLADCLKDAEITEKLNKLLDSTQNDELKQLKDLLDLNLNFAAKTAENELKSNPDALAELKRIKDKIFDENEELAAQLIDIVANPENYDQIKDILQGNDKDGEKLDEVLKIYKENGENPEKTLESLEKLLRNRPVDPVLRRLREDLKLAPSDSVLVPALVASSQAEKEINELKASSNELEAIMEQLKELVDETLLNSMNRATEDWKNVKDDDEQSGEEFKEGESGDKGDKGYGQRKKILKKSRKPLRKAGLTREKVPEESEGPTSDDKKLEENKASLPETDVKAPETSNPEFEEIIEEFEETNEMLKKVKEIQQILGMIQSPQIESRLIQALEQDLDLLVKSLTSSLDQIPEVFKDLLSSHDQDLPKSLDQADKILKLKPAHRKLKNLRSRLNPKQQPDSVKDLAKECILELELNKTLESNRLPGVSPDLLETLQSDIERQIESLLNKVTSEQPNNLDLISQVDGILNRLEPEDPSLSALLSNLLNQIDENNMPNSLEDLNKDLQDLLQQLSSDPSQAFDLAAKSCNSRKDRKKLRNLRKNCKVKPSQDPNSILNECNEQVKALEKVQDLIKFGIDPSDNEMLKNLKEKLDEKLENVVNNANEILKNNPEALDEIKRILSQQEGDASNEGDEKKKFEDHDGKDKDDKEEKKAGEPGSGLGSINEKDNQGVEGSKKEDAGDQEADRDNIKDDKERKDAEDSSEKDAKNISDKDIKDLQEFLNSIDLNNLPENLSAISSSLPALLQDALNSNDQDLPKALSDLASNPKLKPLFKKSQTLRNASKPSQEPKTLLESCMKNLQAEALIEDLLNRHDSLPGLLDAINSKLEDELRDAIAKTQAELHSNPEALGKLAEIEAELKNSDEKLADSLDKVLKSLDPESLSQLSEGQSSDLSPEGLKKALKGRSPSKKLRNMRKDLNAPAKSVPELAKDALSNIETKEKVNDLLNQFSGLPELVAALKDKIEDDLKKEIKNLENILKDPKLLDELQAIKDSIKEDDPNLTDSIRDLLKELGNDEFERFEDLPKELQDLLNQAKNPLNVLDQVKDKVNGDKDLENCLEMLKGVVEGRPTVSDQVKDCIDDYDKLEKVKSLLNESSLLPGLLSDLKSELDKSLNETLSNCRDLLKSDPVLLQKLDEIEKSSGLLPLNPDLVSSLLSNLKSPEFSSANQEEQSPLIKSLLSLLPSDEASSLSSNPDLNEVIEALKSVLSQQVPIEDLINTLKPLIEDDNTGKDNLALLEEVLKPVITSPAYIQDQASNCLKDVKAEKEAKSLLPNVSDLANLLNSLNQKLAEQLQGLVNDAENLIKDPEAIEKLKKVKENLQNSENQPVPSQNLLNNIESKDIINNLINAENLLNLKNLDDKSKDLLGQNLEKIEKFLPKNEENDKKIQDLKKKAQEIDEIPTETQSDHVTRVDKRLDLLSSLELLDSELLKDLNNTLQEKEAKILDMQGHINDIEKEAQDLAQKLQDATSSGEKLAEDLKKMQDKVDDQDKIIKSQGDMLGNTNDENTKMLEKLNKDLQDRDKELRELKEKFGEEVAALNDLVSQAEADKEKNKQLIDQMQKDLDSLQKQVEDQANELAGKDDEINSLKDQVANLESELKQKEEELLNLAYDLKSKDDELAAKDAELQDSLSKLDELADELKAKDQQISDLDNDLKLKNIEILDQAKQIKNQEDLIAAKDNDLQQQASELKGLHDSLKDKEAELIQKNEDLAKADNLINVQKQQLDTQKELLQGTESGNSEALNKLSEEAAKNSKDLLDKSLELERLRRELEEREKERDQLSSDLESSNKSVEDLQNKLSAAEAAHKKGQVRHVLQIFKKKQGKLFKVWVRYSPDKQQVIQLVDTDDLDFIDEVEEVELKNDYIIADQLIDEENRILIESNPIMIQYKQIEGKTEKPMSYVNIFKFLEDLMDKKYETDKKDIKDLRQMRSMTEFMMESLQRQFGIQSLALKFLGQFIPGFYQIYGENHKYAIFFARLLQLFHPEPVTYSLALFLVKVRTDFYPLIEKFERVMHDHGKKDIKKKADQTHGRSAYEAAATGGLAFVSDVIELVYSIFGGDRDSGTKALEIMKPENVTHEDFVLYKICHKMAKLGQTPEQIFNTLDKDGGGSISDKEFITGIKKDLDLWISESNISKLMKRMDVEGTGELSKEVFMKEINMKTFAEKNKNEIWTISKATFLIAMIEVYKFNQRRLTAHLNPKFSKFQKQALDKEEFEELMLGYETSLSVYDVEKLFNEAMSIDPSSSGASFKATTSIMCKYGFSYLKSFKIKELMENLTSRKTIVDVSLTPAEGAKRLTPSISISSEESKRDKNRSIGAEMIGTPTDKQATPSTPHRKLKSGVPPITEEEKKGKRPSGNLGLPPLPDDKGKSPSMIGKKASKK